jgi:peptidoglycan/LPS O-acetylase OafA/YrhL
MTGAESARLSQLTWTRFAAALIVVFFHLGAGVAPISDARWAAVIRNGPVAVTYFFTLSGFIMGFVYRDIKMDRIALYWVSRFARIYPVYLLTLLWFICADHWSLLDICLNLALAQAWFPGHALSMTGVGWSLSVETTFYAIFPALMTAARRVGLLKSAIFIGLVWLVTQIFIHLLAARLNPVFPSASHDFLYYFPIFHLNSFLVGMLGAMISQRMRLPERIAGLVACASIAAAALALIYAPEISRLAGFVPRATHGLLAPLFALAILGIVSLDSRLMRLRGAVFLGETSYAMFIIQFAAVEAVSRLWIPLVPPMTDGKFWPLVVFLVVASFAIFALIETPARHAILKAEIPNLQIPPIWATKEGAR